MNDRIVRPYRLVSILVTVLLSASVHGDGLDAYDELLHRYVDDGQVDYSRFAASRHFETYIDEIAQLNPETLKSEKQRLAFYVNAYNALTIQSILNGKSPASLLGRFRFFKLDKYQVAGESLSLYELEHERLLTLGEPRVHFAIVCASASCPSLRNEIYRAEILDQQLDEQATDFINNENKNAFDRVAKVASVSKIFKWYREDFENSDATLEEYLAFYVKDPETADALRNGDFEMKFRTYDWSLNGTAAR